MRADYLRAQDRKRNLISWGTALVFYALLAAGFLLRGLFAVDSLGSYSGPVMVRIGLPEGTDETSMALPAPAAEGVTEPRASAEETVSPQTAPQPEPLPAKAAEALPGAQAALIPAVEPAPPQGKDSPKTAVAKVPPAPAGAGASSALGPTSPDGTGTTTLKGSEQGNSFQTSYESGSGKIGRSLYVPIYLYMPLPQTVGKALYDAIPPSKDGLLTAELRKVEFRSLYEQTGEGWKLKSSSPIASRPRIWLMLQDAGYQIGRAEYKQGKELRPVVLEFEVGAPESEGRTPELLSVKVISSSGYAELDDAVVYGFRQAAFFNDSLKAIRGRFTYNFDR
jgi:outer membrane biosynthesis protein TonB